MKTKQRILFTCLFMLMFVVGSTGTALATLSGGSTFESGDGDLAPNTSAPPAVHDWNNPVEKITCPSKIPGAGTNCGLDLVKSQVDDALGQGSKEDDVAPTVVDGSIPPSKDDLSRFYVNKERVNGNDYLYLAWERSNLLGSAHMDFEFNQSSALSANGVTPVRTAGDLLIDFDFGGSGVPVLAYHRWITSGNPATDCEANNTLPCWNKAVDLTAAGFAEAQVNSAPVTDTNPPNAPFSLTGNTKNGINSTFGEAGINLTAANIFPQNVCAHFGSAYLKSRSSGNSFSSELKDFIAPIPVNLSNCGTIKIYKQTNPDGATGTFSFTHDVGNKSSPVVPSPFTLSDNGEQDFFSVLAGTYHFTEAATTGFDFNSISCTVTGSGGSNTSSIGPALTITLQVDDVVECTFNNTQQLGALKVTKQSVKGNAPLSGATFTVVGTGVNTTLTTGSDGTACLDHLTWGSYTVTETTAPSGYKIDNPNGVSVSVDHNSTCTSGTPNAPAAFTDTPLSQIQVQFTSLAGSGVTNASIVCTNGSTVNAVSENGAADPALDDTNETFTNLAPGTYTCTVVVDP